MSFALSRKAVLPLAFAGLGASYFTLTLLRKPPPGDVLEMALWQRHTQGFREARV